MKVRPLEVMWPWAAQAPETLEKERPSRQGCSVGAENREAWDMWMGGDRVGRGRSLGKPGWGEGSLPWRQTWRSEEVRTGGRKVRKETELEAGKQDGLTGPSGKLWWQGKVEETLPIFPLSWEKMKKNEHLLQLTTKI